VGADVDADAKVDVDVDVEIFHGRVETRSLTFPLKSKILCQMSTFVVPPQEHELLRVEDLERVEV
jgi:hypothetical protein